MGKVSLNRIIIFGYLVNKLKSFYVEHFGFELIEEIENQWIVLKAGPIELAIHKIGTGAEPEAGKEFRVEGNTKLVFHITGSMEAFRQRLVDNGVVMRDIQSFKGMPSLFCDGEDPEGNMFQLQKDL